MDGSSELSARRTGKNRDDTALALGDSPSQILPEPPAATAPTSTIETTPPTTPGPCTSSTGSDRLTTLPRSVPSKALPPNQRPPTPTLVSVPSRSSRGTSSEITGSLGR